MAYQFADGFDNFGNSYTYTSGYPWDAAVNSPVTTTANVRFAAPGSLPGAALSCGAGAYVYKNLSGNEATLIVGVAINVSALPASGYVDLVRFSDAGTGQCSLSISSTGALQFVRGTSTALIGAATGSGTIAPNAWHGYAMQVTFNGSTGSAVLYLDGSATPAINSSSLNTITTANAYANQVSIGPNGGTGTGSTSLFDDFYCLDTTGVTLNALLGGDARILTKMPASAGNYTNWTPNGLAANWQNTSVLPPSTSDYNANNTGTTKDSYTMQSAGLTVAPYFVVARASMEKDDGTTHTPSIFVRSGSTDSSGVATPALGSSYVFYDAVFATDPNTSIAWTGTGADAAQVGVIEG